MATQPIEDSVYRRIQKLLALADRTEGNEVEAAAHLAKAQELLSKYNLEYHEVRARAVAGGTNAPAEEARNKRLLNNQSAQYRWQRQLWQAIAEANYCFYWTREVQVEDRYGNKGTVRAKRHQLLGRESNVIAVEIMGKYLCDTIQRLLPYPHSQSLSRSANSWREGCAHRLIQRVKADAEASLEVPVEAGNPYALTLRSVVEAEHEANYDAQYGAGAFKEKKEWETHWDKYYEERRIKAEAERIEFLRNESPEAKQKREAAEEKQRIKAERAQQRYSNTYWNKRDREASRVDRTAYSAGAKAGDRINLSKQAATSETKALKGGE